MCIKGVRKLFIELNELGNKFSAKLISGKRTINPEIINNSKIRSFDNILGKKEADKLLILFFIFSLILSTFCFSNSGQGGIIDVKGMAESP